MSKSTVGRRRPTHICAGGVGDGIHGEELGRGAVTKLELNVGADVLEAVDVTRILLDACESQRSAASFARCR